MSEPPHPAFLLSLPGELRNRIWEYALTSSNPIHHARVSRITADGHTRNSYVLSARSTITISDSAMREGLAGSALEFNNIKYVNQQLYDETANLELKCNEVQFSQLDAGQASALDQLVGYTERLTEAHVKWLAKVVLAPHADADALDDVEDHRELSNLIKFYEQHPNVHVTYYLSRWGEAGKILPNFICDGFHLAFLLRGIILQSVFAESSFANQATNRLRQLIGFDHFTAWAQLGMVAGKNIRVFPNKGYLVTTGERDLIGLRATIWVGRSPEERIQIFTAQAEEWIQNGI
ncbi:hypothetical protein FB567DRAFT_616990 [Paraphoma chrysanthemicola]|uniref:Uncharacterized protein n=1 Tax=Paraphoma chrysanthemicola TaxID=798071 RepID=A0A8K0W248_9PLEO|nr:hypothetical protein FB567DRAFT_616990 [Paraphoma chrysanthemicola]